jgi:HJR/Mrr/RecB family endonuclease
MVKLSFKKAAQKILSEAEEPLTATQIADKALAEELIETSGATPEATIAAILYTDLKNNPSSQFKKVGKGLFALKEQKESARSPLLAIQNQNEYVKEKLIDKIHQVDPFHFEHLIAELLRRIGYENVEVTQRSGDKGIDITATLTVGGLTNVKSVIQVKRYKKGNNISGKYITQLRGSAEVDQRGLIVTTSDFTKDAIKEAKAPNKMPVALVNGEKLIDLLFKYQVGVKESTVSVYSLDSEIFDDGITGSEEGYEQIQKNKSIWPLPGGTHSYIKTLNALLDKIDKSKSKKDDLITWFIQSFDAVNSTKTTMGYITVPRNMGLIDVKNGIYILTEDGKKYLKTQDLNFLFKIISKNIVAFEEIYQFLAKNKEPKTDQEIFEFIKENFSVEWTTLAQVSFRLLWLINLGKIEKEDKGYKVKN